MVDKKKEEEKGAEEVKVAETAATEAPKGKTTSVGEYKDSNMEYMKGMYPDKEINDDNYASSMEETMGGMIPKMKSYDEADANLRAMMNGEPKLAKILSDMAQGAKFEEALPRYLDTAELELKPGDPDYTTWEANNKTRKANYTAEEEYKQKMVDNRAKSEVTLANWYEKKGMDDESKQEYGRFVASTLDNAYAGMLDEEMLDKFHYAMNYKADVAKAEEVGTIKGKNEKIVTEKLAEDKKKTADGLPVIDGGASSEKETSPESGNALEKGLRRRGARKSIIPGNA